MQLSGLAIDPTLRPSSCRCCPRLRTSTTSMIGNSTPSAAAEHGGIPVQPDRSERSRLSSPVRARLRLTDAHRFEGVLSYFKEIDDRTDLDVVSARSAAGLHQLRSEALRAGVAVGAPARTSRTSCAAAPTSRRWRSSATGIHRRRSLQHGARHHQPARRLRHDLGFQSQGRYTDTYQLNDNASCVMGNHQLQMGGSWQRNRVNPYNFAGQYPTVTFGFSTAAPASVQLTSAQFPGGISAADLANANAMAALLGGIVSSVAQTFQVRDKTSGYVAGHSVERVLHARQHRALRAGQLALEAELHRSRRPEVGVLQPAARGQQPRVPAGPERPLVRADDARSGHDGHLRRRRVLQEGPEQLRADRRLRLGPDQGRQDRAFAAATR